MGPTGSLTCEQMNQLSITGTRHLRELHGQQRHTEAEHRGGKLVMGTASHLVVPNTSRASAQWPASSHCIHLLESQVRVLTAPSLSISLCSASALGPAFNTCMAKAFRSKSQQSTLAETPCCFAVCSFIVCSGIYRAGAPASTNLTAPL